MGSLGDVSVWTWSRPLLFAAVSLSQLALLTKLWPALRRRRHRALVAYLIVALLQSSTSIWSSSLAAAVDASSVEWRESIFYARLPLKVLEWALAFSVVHALVDGFLAPYRALQSAGRLLMRVGMALGALAALSGAFLAPQETLRALGFLYRFEPLVIYGLATLLCISTAALVSHFAIRRRPNDWAILWTVCLLFGQFAVLWGLQGVFGTPATRELWAAARVGAAVPVLVLGAMQVTAARDEFPSPVGPNLAPPAAALGLDGLNNALERLIRP